MLLRFKVVTEFVIVGGWYANFVLFTLFYFILFILSHIMMVLLWLMLMSPRSDVTIFSVLVPMWQL